MLLEPSDVAEFLNGYMDLMRDLSGRNPSSSVEWDDARDEMLKCLEQNPDASNHPMAQAVRQSVSGRFCFLKSYRDHCAVCHLKSNQFYAVRSLTTPLEEIIDEFSIVHLCLVPFKGMTVCDGLVRSSGTSPGSNLIKNLRDSYWAAKKEGRLIWDPLQTPKQLKPEVSTKVKAAGSSFTAKQGQYLAYIFYFTKIHRRAYPSLPFS